MAVNLFLSIGIVIVSATIVGYFAKMLRQPLIPAYILAGIMIGPAGLRLVTNSQDITILSEIGIVFLLFIVGLELDFSRLKDIGLIASVGTVTQIALLSSLGIIVAMLFSAFSFIEGVYLGLIVSFSSTMVVIKILSDKREIETLHGRIVIGVLLMQDFIALFVLSILSGISNFSLLFFTMALLKAIIIIWVTILSGRYLFPPLFKQAARSQELLFLLAVTICFVFAFVAHNIGEIIVWMIEKLPILIPPEKLAMISPGFSTAIGAFFAGVALANLPYNFEIVAKVKPLRDFFSTLFFASIGMKLAFDSLSSVWMAVIVFSLFVVLFKPFIIMVISNAFGYTPRTSFMTAICLAQTSEFSLIIVTQGLTLGHVSKDFFSMTIVMAVITITISSYYIKFDKELFRYLSPLTKTFLSIGAPHRHFEMHEPDEKYEIILIGYDRIGYSVVKTARNIGRKLLVVDFNPDIIKRLMKEKISCMYGDIGDLELMERIDFRHTDIVISTVPDIRDNKFLIQSVKSKHHSTAVIVTANMIEEALELYDYGADYVILPHFLGGDHLSLMLEDVHTNIKKIINAKIEHIEELKHRKGMGHEHPRRNNPKEHH